MKRVLSLMAALLCLISAARAQSDVTPEAFTQENAPTGAFSASTLSPLTGESFTLTLNVDVPAGIELVDWPQFPQEWGRFEILEINERQEATRSDGTRTIMQRLTARLWRVGDHETPETILTYRIDGVGELRVPVRPAYFSVPTVLDFNDATLRPLRELIDLPYVSPWVIAAALALLIGGALIVGRWYATRPQPAPLPVILSPYEVAQRALESLADAGGTPESNVVGAADVLRAYITARLDLPASMATTPELMQILSEHLPLELVTGLHRLLIEADRVKFGGKALESDAGTQALTYAHSWLNDAESALDNRTDAHEKAKRGAMPESEGA